MQYGICQLSVVPIRLSADDSTEMVSQLLYGEHFKILEQRKVWSKIRMAFDKCEGWVYNSQIVNIEEEAYNKIEKSTQGKFASDLVSFVSTSFGSLIPIIIGSTIHKHALIKHSYEGAYLEGKQLKPNLIKIALLYLNAPFLAGGRTPFGLDSSGFTQIIYKVNGHRLKRTALEQSSQGEALSFIEESEPGDLAFFDNSEGVINHVGLIMENNYIIHSHGKVKIDRIDHTGIFNTEVSRYTHKLRVIKKII